MDEVDLVETAKPIAVQLCVLEECLKRDCGDGNHNQSGLIAGARLWIALAGAEIGRLRADKGHAYSQLTRQATQLREQSEDLMRLGVEIERLREAVIRSVNIIHGMTGPDAVRVCSRLDVILSDALHKEVDGG